MVINFHRRGFANNSSSTHSIIQMSDKELSEVSDTGDTDFGWQEFKLKDRESKAFYLVTMLKTQLYEWSDPEYVKDGLVTWLLKEVMSKYVSDAYNLSSYQMDLQESTVDHQSVFNFPMVHEDTFFTKENNLETKSVDMDFFHDFVDYIIDDDNIVIFGGNDNADSCEADSYTNNSSDWFKTLIRFMEYGLSITCVKDEDNWILYDKDKGTELSVSFKGKVNKVSSVPGLIDLKITDYCEHNCYHCYQGSNKKGSQADRSNVIGIIDRLKRNGTGTVAIGGGNPLLYPDIVDVVEYASSRMTTCLTCNTVTTEKEFDILNKVMPYVDSIAVTCNDYYSVVNTVMPFKALKAIHNHRTSIYMQGILEMFSSEDQLDKYLTAAEAVSISNITLLGYKPVGRAEGREKKDLTYDWIAVCKKHDINIGIDADISKRYSSLIAKHNIDKIYLTEEGNRSMFIDAVKMEAFKDSYSSDNSFHIDSNGWGSNDTILLAYKSFKQ